MLGDRADHVEPCRLGHGRRTGRIRTAVLGDVEANAAHALGRIEHRGPGPGRDRDVDWVLLGGDGHHLFAASEGDRAHVLVATAIEAQNLSLGCFQLLDRIGDGEVHDVGGAVQALGVLA